MNLQQKIKEITGKRRHFLLMRIAGIDTPTARALIDVARGTYNTWFNDERWIAIYRQLPELEQDHRHEAIQLLRRENQLEAVLLEADVVKTMRAELANGKYDLIRTNLAREVYNKLISDLDVVPRLQALSWSQRVQQFFASPSPGLIEGEYHETQESEAISSEQEKHSEGDIPSDGQ